MLRNSIWETAQVPLLLQQCMERVMRSRLIALRRLWHCSSPFSVVIGNTNNSYFLKSKPTTIILIHNLDEGKILVLQELEEHDRRIHGTSGLM
jgi:hypothetical protein